MSAPAALATTDTWTGQQLVTTPPIGNWAQAANWSGRVPASGDALSFPRLTSCASSMYACLTSFATSSVSIANLSIADDEPYSLSAVSAAGLTLDPPAGTDGIDAATTGAGLGSPYVAIPLVLGDSQHWSVAGNGAGSGGLQIAAVTGSAAKLAVTLSGGGQLYFDGGVGSDGLTVTGSGGSTPAQNGLVALTNNADDVPGDSPITVENALLALGNYAGGEVETGSVVLQGGALTVGAAGPNGPGRASVSGTVGIDSASTTTVELEGAGTTAGSDYAQLVASGNVGLGGQLVLNDEGAVSAVCPTAALGTSDTFLTTTAGTLTGQFSNAPNGAITSFTARCGGATSRYPVRIGYTPTAVTGTFVAPGATTNTITASAASSVAGGDVTFTATLTPAGPGAGLPTGVVQFLDGTTPISCGTGGPLSGVSPDVATCTTPYLPDGPNLIIAVYRGDGAWAGSTASAVPVTVSPVPASVPTTNHPSTTRHRRAGSGVPRLRLLKAKAASVRARVSCARGGASCTVRLRLVTTEKVRHHGRRVTHRTIVLTGKRLKIAAGHHRVVTLRLDKTGRRMLARTRVLRVRLILQRRLGNVHNVTSRKLTLRAPRHHRNRRHHHHQQQQHHHRQPHHHRRHHHRQ